MRSKEFIPSSKPRNFVAKNQKTAGAGAHKDKKRAAKQGDVKHKGKDMAEASSPAQQAAIAVNMKKNHKKPKNEDISRRGFLRGIGAAAAGAAGLGAAGKAQAQISGEDTLPDIVAHVRFKVDGKEITKDINLGTEYKSPGQASEALAKFLKSKGIKYYDFSLERVKHKDNDYLDKAPYADRGNDNGRIDTGPASDIKSKSDYMSKEGMSEVAPPTAKGERMVKHIKKGYAKDGKLTDKERSIAYATAWKAHNSKD